MTDTWETLVDSAKTELLLCSASLVKKEELKGVCVLTKIRDAPVGLDDVNFIGAGRVDGGWILLLTAVPCDGNECADSVEDDVAAGA